jgi:hypothetical protein
LYSHLCIYVSMYLCIYVSVYLYIYVSLHLCIYASMYLYSYPSTHSISGEASACACKQFMMHLKMTIEWTQRCTGWLWLIQFENRLGGQNCYKLEATIERVCGPRMSACKDPLRKVLRARLEVNLEEVNGRPAGHWLDCIDDFLCSHLWECDEVSIPLSSHGDMDGGSWYFTETRQNLKPHSRVDLSLWEWREDTPFWVDAVFGVCCTWCILYVVLTYNQAMDR